jgi:hypothetical protein
LGYHIEGGTEAESVEKRVLRNIFGRKRDKLTGEWRRLHNDELYELYFSPNIIRVRKSRIMRLAGHVARMVDRRGAHTVLVGRPEGKIPFEDLNVDGRIMIKWIFRKCYGAAWTGLIWPRLETGSECLWMR